ncbi:probable multidrug resistance-associated protein lethal(2)03659 isoform X2 [Belonocnema kinseyi]|uniref:probable multidrug resistance-associated protein lethal(2)03659 isoform X2 n=1 Tax=Belonocnema kinseyi TaxID=2817044 RepID=UPI00143DF07B|nr:probable multidrug resistance-associated protein lethal(2)03659 isoform X2 [Belonocnema kinseyi]XP_033217290.1 probable multidrug resistance-associated protein lethal(2)03659 isoform X2 [Belonocnema kinseyi]XP_033217299.1 probable multidrug resistance-associated protein lethal(2)03659 isoform X2 [Belonocnema kinseyi]
MEETTKKRSKNPYKNANFFSRISFVWMIKIFRLGYRRELEESDLYEPLKSHSSSFLGEKLYSLWQEEEIKCKNKKSSNKPSLIRALIKCFKGRIMMIGLAQGFLEIIIKLPQPIVLSKVIKYFSGTEQMSKNEAYLWASILVMSLTIFTFLMHPCVHAMVHMGMKFRIACSSLIFRKILKISKTSLETKTTVGQIVNMLSNDVSRFDYALFGLNYIWIAPIQIIIMTYIMYQEVGWSALIGMAVLVLTMPFQGIISKWIVSLTMRASNRTDERLRLMNEIINGVQVIKMYAWERPFSALVDKARAKEISTIKQSCFVDAITLTFETYIPRLCIFATIFSYIMFGNGIAASSVYMVTAYYNELKYSFNISFCYCIQFLAKTLVTIRRIEEFMLYKEIKRQTRKEFSFLNVKDTELLIETNEKKSIPMKVAISLQDFTAKWSAHSHDDTLKNITFVAKIGSLNAIIGPVGSGKTSLLLAILSELPMQGGNINVQGKIAYASQEPWIFSANVKQNILFGQKMNQQRYDRVVKVCQLERDLALFPFGDKTIIGEKGVNLSGGQRARINLARAVYAEADVYLLDDPLSAVDSKVGKGIFNECIDEFLRGKTRILVTHQFQYLKNADNIIVLNNGGIKAEGTFTELQGFRLDFIKVLQTTNGGSDDIVDQDVIKIIKQISITSSTPNNLSDEDPKEISEARSFGSISGMVYLSYFKAVGSICLVLLVIFLSLLFQLAATGTDKFLAIWVNEEEISATINDQNQFPDRYWYVYVYCGLTAATVIIVYCQVFMFYEMCMRSSKNLHSKMFKNIIRATMSFFHANSPGRIINRFSKDIGAIDRNLPMSMLDITQIGLSLVAVITITITVNPWFAIPTIITGAVCYFLRDVYISTSRSVKRLDGITRSPVFNYVSSTAQGLTTIRAFNSEHLVKKEFDDRQDVHSTAYFIFLSASRTFGAYIELIYTMYINIVIFLFLTLDDAQVVGNVGLVITQCLSIAVALQWCLRQTAEVENQMTSVERVLEYSKLKEEPSLESKPENKPPKDWPTEGRVQFEQVNLRYSPDGATVLQNLSFSIEPKEKIGIVGRTGAGKSSLLSALFRLAYLEGEIYIDGIPTSSLGLHDLRSKISIIPQEPVLFAGTLRKNLDPFDEYSDDTLWHALAEVELNQVVIDMGPGLSMHVSDGGTNFSLGQRQLLCLARAIVKNNKILLLDEATANVDPQTDELIQETIRKRFEHCTVLIIAHRLNTVMDCDRFIVMDAGTMVEFDKPMRLLERKQGFLYDMVQNTGPEMADFLAKMAKTTSL